MFISGVLRIFVTCISDVLFLEIFWFSEYQTTRREAELGLQVAAGAKERFVNCHTHLATPLQVILKMSKTNISCCPLLSSELSLVII